MSRDERGRNHKWFFIGLAALSWVVLVNIFPSGYIILGGDVLQALNLKEQYASLHYGWFSGRVSLFYGLFYLLDLLGVSPTAQLSWYLALFLFGAYLSFWLFCRLLFPRAAFSVTALISLFYATNVYTLYIFTATWGFTSYQILYVFVPALVGLYLKTLVSDDKLFLFSFLLVIFLASMSFSNPAFAVSLVLAFLILTGLLFISRFLPFNWPVMKKIVLLICGTFLLNAYWILPLLPQMSAGVQEISVSTDIVLAEALKKTSNAIYDTVRLLPTHEQKTYFPYNFPYPSLSWMKPGLATLAFLPFFLIAVGLLMKMSRREKLLYTILLSLFVIFIALVARGRFPFDTFNMVIFQLPVLNALRGWDKLAIYTPFFLSALLLLFFSALQGKKYFRIILAAFCLVTFLLALPFYVGGLQTKMSYILAGAKKKDFAVADYSALVKIPEPYYRVGEIFEKEASESKISMLPFSPGSSIGRVSLPKWKVNGPHPATTLYDHAYVELNNYYIEKWIFAEEFERNELDPRWIADVYGLLGIEYIFYHKDAKPKSLEKFEPARRYLEGKNVILPLTENKWFTLYRLDPQYLFPYVYAASEAFTLITDPGKLSEPVRTFKEKVTALPYEETNPKKIVVATGVSDFPLYLYLNERYDPLWQARYVSPQGKARVMKRRDEVRYANAWETGKVDEGGKIEIYYMPLRLLHLGGVISGMTLLYALFGTVRTLRKKYNLKKPYIYETG